MQKMIAGFDQLLKDSNLPDEDIITNHGTFIKEFKENFQTAPLKCKKWADIKYNNFKTYHALT